MHFVFSFIISLFLSLNVFAFPELTDGVVDEANILSDMTEQSILQMFEQEGVTNVVVATVSSLEGKTVEQYATELGNYWGVGNAKYDNGVLLLIAPNEGYVRIATGLGMEKVLTDGAANVIVQSQMMPYLKQRDFDTAALMGVQGILAGIRNNGVFPNQSHIGSQIGKILLLVFLLLILWAVFYVLSAHPGTRMNRINKIMVVIASVFGVILMIFLFLLHLGKGGRGGRFSGGGHFGGGGASGKF